MTVGVTGHQQLPADTQRRVRDVIRARLANIRPLTGVTSLAEGADQLFATIVLSLGGDLVVIVPARHYERSFANDAALAQYLHLRAAASQLIELPFDEPGEAAYWAAGLEIVGRCDVLFAVWDGSPAAGLGGTGDVVRHAERLGKEIVRIWPAGSRRRE